MELFYALAGLALLLYFVGYSIGYFPSDDEKPSLHGVGAMLAGGFVCLVLWTAMQGSVRAPGGAVVIVIFMLLFGALFLFGLGRFLGTLVSARFAKGATRRFMVFATTGLPVLAVAGTLYSVSRAEAGLQAEQAAARAALQSGTYQARFGAHDIVFPGAPVFVVVHPCATLSRNCTTLFWASAGWNRRADGPLEIVSLEVNPNPTALQDLTAWCAERPAFETALWCQFTAYDEMRLKRVGDLRGVESERTTSCTQIFNGAFTCRATHDLTEGIAAVLDTVTKTEASGRDLIETKRERAELLWSALTAGSQR